MTQKYQNDNTSPNAPKERATLVTAHLPAEEIALRETFSAVPDLSFECVQIVASGNQTVLPLLWLTTDDYPALNTALEDDPSVVSARELLQADGRRLYRFEWSDDVCLTFRVLLDVETVLLDGYGDDSRWTFELLFPTRDALGRTCDRCQLYDVTYSIERIQGIENDDGNTPRPTNLGLTAQQYEAIATAYEHGYFTVPRQITLDELATHLDISHQALSERLRRAHDTLIGESLRNPCLGFGLSPDMATNASSETIEHRSEEGANSAPDSERPETPISDRFRS
ncbi:helix-turn-helix domain-containing protein [Halocatena salina]|uniref:Helix-turn-helix domain-containing protein n=1 Tax=Halocatena salina TaxID=2934340 RepID=A0A8U0A0B9_9EURY|nr:helix-turn-helix domain-containing protein [Halocatena salina]UPM42514.1 helix-turn-helix domain-containing protein [Halocatena salina]